MNDSVHEVPQVSELKLRTRSHVLEVTYVSGERFSLGFEYLRVHSPSAEVQGHGAGAAVVVLGKENVGIKAVEPVGHYAVRLVFDDGHDSGLFTWRYLYELGRDQETRMAAWRARAAAVRGSDS